MNNKKLIKNKAPHAPIRLRSGRAAIHEIYVESIRLTSDLAQATPETAGRAAIHDVCADSIQNHQRVLNQQELL